MKCTTCGAESTGKFCPICGTLMPQPPMIQCSACGKTFQGKFCPDCGRPAGEKAPSAPNNPPTMQAYRQPDQASQLVQQAYQPPQLYQQQAQPVQQAYQQPQPYQQTQPVQQAYQQPQQFAQQPMQQPNIVINNINANANVNGMGGMMVSPKSKVLAAVLCLLFGFLGIHRFYVGKIGTGLLYFFTGGFLGIGALVDLINILLGGFRDGGGLPIKN